MKYGVKLISQNSEDFEGFLTEASKILSSLRLDNRYYKLNLLNFEQVYEQVSLMCIHKYFVHGSGSDFKEKL